MMQAASGGCVAQAGAGAVMVWSIVLIIGLIGLFLIVLGLKRWLWSSDVGSSGAAGLGFTLSDLRAMHRRGELSDEEFERMRGQVVDAARRSSVAEGVEDADSAPREVK